MSDPLLHKKALQAKHVALSLSVVLIICALSFAPSLENDFVNWDDSSHLLRNHTIHPLNITNIKRIFTSLVLNETYIPLAILSFSIEHHFFQYDPFIYHLDNLILHLGVTTLVFSFALQVGMPLRAAFMAALLFGIHPMRVESVAWITERKDVLYAFFYMLALCFYWQYISKKKLSLYCTALVFGLLSILAKPMALSLPLILLVCDWFKKRKFDRSLILEKIPFFLYAVSIAWITYSVHARIPGENFQSGILIWVYTFVFYIRQFLLPFSLSPLYALPEPVSWANVHYAGSMCLLFLMLILILRLRRNRWILFAVLFYFLSIFFLLRYDNVPIGVVADRFMYLPSLGFCLLFGIGVDRFLGYCKNRSATLRLLTSSLFVLLFIFLSFKTSEQTKIWKNSQSLWSYVIAIRPDAAIAYNNRGTSQERLDLALMDYNQTIKLDPEFPEAYFNRGKAYDQLGKYSLAIEDYTRCISFDANDAEAYYRRSLAYKKIGELKKSSADQRKSRSLGYSEK